jgi:hypothetical protein
MVPAMEALNDRKRLEKEREVWGKYGKMTELTGLKAFIGGKYSAICNTTLNNLGGTAKRPTGAWGWSVVPSTPKLEDSLGGATHHSLRIGEYLLTE